MTQRADSTSRSGQWCLPSGGIKIDESAEEACLRETFEETGIEIRVIRQLAITEDSTYFLCEPSTRPQLCRLDPQEVQKAIWYDPSQILDLGPIIDLGKLIPLLMLADLMPPVTPELLELYQFKMG